MNNGPLGDPWTHTEITSGVPIVKGSYKTDSYIFFGASVTERGVSPCLALGEVLLVGQEIARLASVGDRYQ